jgi:O-antigen biosynthesis protein
MISIFTPTHDTRYLLEAYNSLLAQSVTEWEWIVVYNNGAVPVEFNDKRVKTFALEAAKDWVGPLKAAACRRASGDILLELDHDDLLIPDALEEVTKAFRDQEIGFVYSNTVHCDSDWNPVMRFDERYGWKYRQVEYDGHLLDEHVHFAPNPDCISKIWFAPNHLRAFRKSVYDIVGGYDEGMRVLDDLDLICRLYEVTKFKHIDKGLYIYRVHGENTWLRYNKEIQDNVYRIHDQYIERLVSRWSDTNSLRKIELGGRIDADDNCETVDLLGSDIIADLEEKWPFEDSSVGMIRAIDVFEHLKDPMHTMKELSRVLAPGGWAFIKVPSTDGRGAFQDPTHKSFWNENSFGYYTKEFFSRYIGEPVRFQAARLYTTELNSDKCCWTIAHLVNCKEGYRPAGLMEI